MSMEPKRSLFERFSRGADPAPKALKAPKEPSALRAKWNELPLATRRKVLIGLVATLYVVVIGGGVFYNFMLLSTYNSHEAEVMHRADSLATMPLLRTQILEAQRIGAELDLERQFRFNLLPDWSTVPLAVEWLESLQDVVGGHVRRVDYSPPRWQGDAGVVPVSLEYVGSFDGIVNYLTAATAGLPSLAVGQLTVAPVSPTGEELRLLASMRLEILESRPEGVDGWDGASRPRPVVQEGDRSPFAPPPGLWSAARRAGVGLPELGLQGIAQAGDERLAVLVLDGHQHVVRSGTRLGDVLVVRVDPEAVVVQVGTRQATLALRE